MNHKPLLVLLSSVLIPSVLVAADAPAKITYQDHVQPIFRQHCGTCHNTDKKIADLDLTNYTSMMQGGGSGAVIEPGDAENSYLYMLVTHNSEPAMPPKQDKLAAASLDLIKKWIDGGALENAGSKAMIAKPKFDLSLTASPTGRPEGPPPMPELLSLEPVVHTGATTAITALATNPWSPLVAVSGQKQVVLYNTKTLEMVGVLPFPEGVPQSLKFSQNGSLLLAGGGHDAAKGRVVVWNVRTGERVIEVGDELDTVLAADISSDQTLVALGGPGKVVRVYSTQTGEL
jgi:mono/diheme cytochrome c family protein